jgi:hypothetical protein
LVKILSFFLSSTDIAKCLEEVDQTIKQKQELLESLTKEQQKIRREMDVVFRLYMNNKISAEGFALRNTPLEERLKQTDDQRRSCRVNSTISGSNIYLATKFLLKQEISILAGLNWSAMTNEPSLNTPLTALWWAKMTSVLN